MFVGNAPPRERQANRLHLSYVIAALFSGVGVEFARAEPVTLEAELVTIQGRKIDAQDAAGAASSMSGRDLESFDVFNFADAALFFPGLSVQEQSPALPGFVMRGVTTDSGAAFTEARIGLFRDGAPAARNRGAYTELFDIDRIEVYRGPQPSLYGRNAMTGAVNVVERKAQFSENEARFEGALGDHAYRRAFAMGNWSGGHTPIAVRAAGQLRAGDGFVENENGGPRLGSYDVHAGRLSLAYEPNPRLRADLIFNVHRDENAGTAFRSATFAPAHGNLDYFEPAALNRSVQGFENGAEIGLDRRVDSVLLIGDWRIGDGVQIQSLSAYRVFELFDVFDADGSPLPLLFGSERSKGRQLSQELRVVWGGAGPWRGFLGAAFSSERASQRVATAYNEHFFLPLLLGLMPGPATPTQAQADALSYLGLTSGLGLSAPGANGLIASLAEAHSEYYQNSSKAQSSEIFSDVTYEIGSRLDVSGGFRYALDEKQSGLEAGLLDGPSPLGAALAGLFSVPLSGPPGLFIQPQAPIERERRFDGWSWRLAALFEADQGLQFWASLAEGRTPNVIAMSAGNLPGARASTEILPAETIKSTEFGMRLDLDPGVELNVSAYDYRYEDFQTSVLVNGTFRSINAGRASAYGLDVDWRWRAAPTWSVLGAYNFNHARFTSGAFDGDRFRLAPDHSLSLGVLWRREIAGGELGFSALYDWRSKVFFDNNNDRRDLQPPLLASVPSLRDREVDEFQDAYGLLNLRLDWSQGGGLWRASLFARNALDEHYLLDAGNVGDSFTFPTFIRGPGRMLGLEIERAL